MKIYFLNTLVGKSLPKKERYVILSVAICMTFLLLNSHFDFAKGPIIIFGLAVYAWFYISVIFFLLRAAIRSFPKIYDAFTQRAWKSVLLYTLNAACFIIVAYVFSGFFMPSTPTICPNDPGCDINEMKLAILSSVAIIGALYTLWIIRKYEDAAN